MEMLRPASSLPAIKCSLCGAEILISSMGEHECGQASSAPPTTTTTSRGEVHTGPSEQENLPERHGRVADIANTSSTSHLRPPRTALPRIDAAAANKPYLEKDFSSPSSYGSLPNTSPLTPLGSRKSTGLTPMRSMTSPVPRIHRPPSPQLSSNLDCAFPPFPKSRPTSHSVSSPKQKRTNAPADGNGGSIYGASLHAEPESFCGPKSPTTTGSAHVVQRMDSIAPGPFDTRRRASNGSSPSRRSPPSKLSSGTAFVNDKHEQRVQADDVPTSLLGPPQQVYTPSSPEAPAFVAVAPPTNREGKIVPHRPMRPEPLDGFLAMLKREAPAPAVPAVTLAKPVDGEHLPPPTVCPDDGTGNDAQAKSHSVLGSSDGCPEIVAGSMVSAAVSDLPGNVTMPEQTLVPLMPKPSAQHQAPTQHTAHTPSGSASSTSSIRSYGGNSFRFDLSPPVSATSSVSVLSATLEEGAREQDATITTQSAQGRSKQSMLRLTTPASSCQEFSSTPSSVLPVDTISQYNGPTVTLETVDTPVASPLPYSDSPSSSHHASPLDPLPLTYNNARSQNSSQRPLEGPSKRPSTKRPGTATRHTCRGCEEVIVGKSVKAADGRLTGRYHKQCFVCMTCRSPFATADFYVIDNNPYCERHYHQLNKSLCTGCDRGIEGPYLETQQTQKKFHLDCFTCLDCHKVLNNDYFEISDAVYCEQHALVALRRNQGLSPKRDMERRTTRLMMMSQ